MVADCGARMVVVGSRLAGLARGLGPGLPAGTAADDRGHHPRVGLLRGRGGRRCQPTPVPDECEGDVMLYSSGTTGRPKGIKRPITGMAFGGHPDVPGRWLPRTARSGRGGRLPLARPALPRRAAGLEHVLSPDGATVVVMERFDAEEALRLIDRHRVTHSQWVPTMFVRLLKLPRQDRGRLRREQPALGRARRGALPGSRQAGHDRLVGADPVRVLLDDRGLRRGLDLLRRVAAQAWLRRPAADGHPAHPRRQRRRTAARRDGHDLVRGRHALRSTTATRRRRRGHSQRAWLAHGGRRRLRR